MRLSILILPLLLSSCFEFTNREMALAEQLCACRGGIWYLQRDGADVTNVTCVDNSKFRIDVTLTIFNKCK